MIEVPEDIERILKEFEASDQKLTARQICTALGEARTKLVDKTAIGNAWPDVVAFAFQRGAENHGPWNTYFGSEWSRTYKDGTEEYNPDVRQLTPDVIKHWEQRAKTITHPIMQARYADVVWEFSRRVSNKKPGVEFARIAIDCYLHSVQAGLQPDRHDDIVVLIRSARLAIQINDADRISRAKTALLEAFDTSVLERTWWWKISDEFAASPKLDLDEVDRERLRAGWEQLLADYATDGSTSFDPFHAETVGKHLIKFYRKAQSPDDATRVAHSISDAFSLISREATAMQAMGWLETAAEYANIAGDKDKHKAIRIEREEAIQNSREEMQSFSVTQTISKEDMEKFLDDIVDKDSWPRALFGIAIEFLFAKERLRRDVARSAKKAVFMSLITAEVIADDHVAATIGSVQDDQEGNLYREADFTQQFNSRYLTHALYRTVELHKLSAEEITTFIFQSELLHEFGLVREGIRAWMDEDYVKALFTLVPQIEAAFRKLARRSDETVTKPKKGTDGWEVSKNLGDFLSMDSIKETLGEDIIFHMRYVFADPRGLNLRNLVAHGLATSGYASWKICDLVVHGLLVLGAYKDVATMAERRARAIKDSPVEPDDDDDNWEGEIDDAEQA